MRRSKLESYESILEVLVNKPRKLEQIAYQAALDCRVLQEHLKFLMKNELVEARTSGKRATFAITERGVAVLRALNFQKYLAKIKSSIRAVDEALQVVPEMSEPNRGSSEKA
jgi:predicted transcriptional regulator